MRKIFLFINFFISKYQILSKCSINVIFLLIFIILIPVANFIDFFHNDDWVYTLNVSQFLNGNFSIHPYIAANFYSTAFLGFLFSYLFGIQNLPILTVLVSVLTSFFLYKTIYENLGFDKTFSFLVSMLFLLNPLFVFTSWGFMTDNFFAFFLISSFYYFSKPGIENLRSKDTIFFLLGIIFVILAYFTRQIGILSFLSFGLYFLISKKYKASIILLFCFILNALYHFFLFPKTSEAFETMLVIDNLTHFQYIFSLFIAILAYLIIFSLPLVFFSLYSNLKSKNKIIYFSAISIFFLLFTNFYFKNIGWIGEKMYFLNYSLNTKGFFPENISGVRSESFLGRDTMLFLQNISIFLGFMIILVSVFRKQKLFLNPFSFFLIFYFGVMLLSVKIYDRYLIPMFPIFILFLLFTFKENIFNISKDILSRIVLGVCVLMLFIYSYNLSADYLILNKYVWNKSIEITKLGVSPSSIYSTDAWRYLYGRDDTYYKFTYDADFILRNSGKNSQYELLESFKISYPFSFFNNTIYLYRK